MKEQNTKKNSKKEPLKSLKEKRAAKKEKKDSKKNHSLFDQNSR